MTNSNPLLFCLLQKAISGTLIFLLSGHNHSSEVSYPESPQPTMAERPNMSPDKAFLLYLAWKKFVGTVRKPTFTGIKMESDGSFHGTHGSIDFEYSFPEKKLMVMRTLVTSGIDQFEYSNAGIRLYIELAKKEPYTTGGGEFYINPRPWLFEGQRIRNPNMNSLALKRDYADNAISADSFVLDLRWLSYWGEYWAPIGGHLIPGVSESGVERAIKSADEQAATRPALEKWARRILSRKEPPLVSASP